MGFRSITDTLNSHPVLFSLILFEFFQKFSLFGSQSVMFLFLKHELKFQLHNSMTIYHLYVGLSYLTPVVGTVLADLYWSKMVTVVAISTLTLVGNILVILVAVALSGKYDEVLLYVYENATTFATVGLVMRAVGVGGIREVGLSMGDDQFNPTRNEVVHKREARARDSYYEVLHYFITLATIVGTCLPPALRMQIECNGRVYCYPMAFAMPFLSLLIAYFVLLGASRSLKKTTTGTSWIVEAVTVLKDSAFTRGGLENVANQDLAYDIRIVNHILALYTPLPFFWALYEQMGSRWVYQASRMKTTVDISSDLYVEPDQMQVLNPLLLLVLLPLLEVIFYPLLRRMGCKKMLKPQMRMYVGGLLAIMAFIAAAIVEYRNEPSHALVPRNGESELWYFNTLDNNISTSFVTSIKDFEETIVPSMDMVRVPHVPCEGIVQFTFTMFWLYDKCQSRLDSIDPHFTHYLIEKQITAIVMSPWFYVPSITLKNADYDHQSDDYFLEECASRQGPILDAIFTNPDRCDLQLPRVGIIYFTRRLSLTRKDDEREDFSYPDQFDLELVDLRKYSSGMKKFLDPNHNSIDFFHMYPSTYLVKGGKSTKMYPVDDFQIMLRRGGIYILYYIHDGGNPHLANLTTVVKPLNVSVWNQVPQYVLMSVAMYLYPLTLLEYSLTQIPIRLKSVLVICWMLTIALGNFLVALFSFPHIFNRDLNNYILYIMLMVLDVLLLKVVLWNYIPVAGGEMGDSEDDDGDPITRMRQT